MKPKILFTNESSVLKTGYAIYGKEVLTRLYNSGKYQLAEHAMYVNKDDPRIQNLPWVVYANMPDKNNEKEVQRYNSSVSNQFGAWRHEEICLDCLPHVVCDIRDFWMSSFLYNSPLRPYHNLALMPTVDAMPQNDEWISMFKNCDGIFTYQDWSLERLEEEGGGDINLLGSASPAADDAFKPYNKENIKNQLGFEGKKIIGTVMRNQRRKLFPDLFKSFRQFLNTTKRDDILLYCHTSYPDMGWDIPKLLLENGLTSKVLFTYICKKCNQAVPHHFGDSLITCPKCKTISSSMSNVQNGVDNNTLAAIYNLFDLFILYSNSEGAGMPVLEAGSCGIPIMSVNYSAQEDIIKKLGAVPLNPKSLSLELETGCYRAVPDNEDLVEKLNYFFNKLNDEQRTQIGQQIRENYLRHYGWDKTAKKWMDYFDTIDIDKYEKLWRSKPNIHQIPNEYPTHLNNKDFSEWLIVNVLGEPRFLNTYMQTRLIHDLNYGVTATSLTGMYFNEHSQMFSKANWKSFQKEDAFKHFSELGKRKNHWETMRWKRIQQL